MSFFTKKFVDPLPSHLLIKGRSVPLLVREMPQARRLTLRWKAEKEGQVILTAPPSFSKRSLQGFVEKSMPWLEEQMAKSLPKVVCHHGMTLTVFGKDYEVRHKPSSALHTWWGEDYLLIHSPPEKLGVCIRKTLQQAAYQFLQEKTHAYASKVDKAVNHITLRDTRSRWGSCTAQGNISYSWRLVFAPQDVAAYVCAHEVAHLAEMNHSPQFWKVVQKFCPDYKNLRRWLRQNGKELFRYEG